MHDLNINRNNPNCILDNNNNHNTVGDFFPTHLKKKKKIYTVDLKSINY